MARRGKRAHVRPRTSSEDDDGLRKGGKDDGEAKLPRKLRVTVAVPVEEAPRAAAAAAEAEAAASKKKTRKKNKSAASPAVEVAAAPAVVVAGIKVSQSSSPSSGSNITMQSALEHKPQSTYPVRDDDLEAAAIRDEDREWLDDSVRLNHALRRIGQFAVAGASAELRGLSMAAFASAIQTPLLAVHHLRLARAEAREKAKRRRKARVKAALAMVSLDDDGSGHRAKRRRKLRGDKDDDDDDDDDDEDNDLELGGGDSGDEDVMSSEAEAIRLDRARAIDPAVETWDTVFPRELHAHGIQILRQSRPILRRIRANRKLHAKVLDRLAGRTTGRKRKRPSSSSSTTTTTTAMSTGGGGGGTADDDEDELVDHALNTVEQATQDGVVDDGEDAADDDGQSGLGAHDGLVESMLDMLEGEDASVGDGEEDEDADDQRRLARTMGDDRFDDPDEEDSDMAGDYGVAYAETEVNVFGNDDD